jgi:ubiquinone/menaquinone biosynthesis C-methylase UbiE
MGYVFDFNDSVAYVQWLEKDGNQATINLERRLISEMVKPECGDRLIDIGCGTGASLMPFMGKGIQLTGVEPSPYMLDIAQKKLGHKVDFHRAVAEDLPFEDNSFEFACLCFTLEFVQDPKKALEEACRVAKDGVFVGFLNKFAIKAFQRRIMGIFNTSIYNRARFFSINEMKYLFYELLGDVPVSWRTVCQFPEISQRFTGRMESLAIVQKSPFGAFAGMMALPIPRLRTTPLTLKTPAAKSVPSNSRPVSCAEKKVEINRR